MKVAPLRKGSRLRVVSPAGCVRPERLARGVEALCAMGFLVSTGAHVLDRSNGWFAGSPEARIEDLHDAFRDPSVDGIICSRGGYGSNYLLERLDRGLIAANPKPLLGYSDVTAIQTWLLDEVGLPAFHAPMAAADFDRPDGVDEKSLLAALGGEPWELGEEAGLRILRPGKAEGVLYGGCLTLLVASMGTPYEPRTEGKLLFLEDINVKLYQLDRLLRQMILGEKFSGVTGIVFGEMIGCLDPAEKIEDLDAVLLRVLGQLNVPLAAGLRSGHVSRSNATLVFGVPAELHLEETPRLQFTKPAAGF